jgi:hypothetical protein
VVLTSFAKGRVVPFFADSKLGVGVFVLQPAKIMRHIKIGSNIGFIKVLFTIQRS